MLTWLLSAAASCSAIALGFILWSRSKPRVPGPPGHWLAGNLRLLTEGKLHENVLAAFRQHDQLFSMRIFRWTFYVASDPAIATMLLKGGPKVAVKRTFAYWMFDQMTTPACMSVLSREDDDPYWKVVRSAAAQAFATKNLKVLFDDIVACTMQGLRGDGITAASRPTQGGPSSVDVDALCLRITVDILGSFLRGRPFGAASGAPCAELRTVENECKLVGEYVKHPYRPYMLWKKEVRDERRWNREFEALVCSMLAELRAFPPPAHTLGAQLLATKDPHTGGPLSDLHLRAELGVFLMAGFENTGHAAALALFSIITHEGVQERVCAELDSLGLLATPDNPTARRLEWGDLGKLRVLSAAVQESMRWLPVAGLVPMRRLRQDLELRGAVLPKGSGVWLPLMAIHRDPRNWDRPDEYDIDRWLGGEVAGAGQAGLMEGLDGSDHSKGCRGYLPFSEGPRNCVGQALARVEVLAVLALLLGSFHVQLAPEMGGREGMLNSLDIKMALRPEGGLWCRLAPRALG